MGLYLRCLTVLRVNPVKPLCAWINHPFYRPAHLHWPLCAAIRLHGYRAIYEGVTLPLNPSNYTYFLLTLFYRSHHRRDWLAAHPALTQKKGKRKSGLRVKGNPVSPFSITYSSFMELYLRFLTVHFLSLTGRIIANIDWQPIPRSLTLFFFL